MKKSIVLSFILFLGASLTVCLFAQVPPPPDPNVIPIDGGLSALIAICSGYGIRKIYKKNKIEKNI